MSGVNAAALNLFFFLSALIVTHFKNFPCSRLAELIEYPTWRSLIYRLAEDYPDCLMLNFTIKLISDAGFQGEITSISTAAQQIEVFSRSRSSFFARDQLKLTAELKENEMNVQAKLIGNSSSWSLFAVSFLTNCECNGSQVKN